MRDVTDQECTATLGGPKCTCRACDIRRAAHLLTLRKAKQQIIDRLGTGPLEIRVHYPYVTPGEERKRPPLTDEQYIDAFRSFLGAEDYEIECRTTKIVKVRKVHKCWCMEHGHGSCHAIAIGERAVRDHAIVDGAWNTMYLCLPCLTTWYNHCEYGDSCTCAGGNEEKP